MTRRFHLCCLSVLTAAAFVFLPSILHAQLVRRPVLNGASLGGLSAGTVTNLPFAASAEDEAYGEILGAIRRGAPSLLERVLANYAHTPRSFGNLRLAHGIVVLDHGTHGALQGAFADEFLAW